MPKVGILELDLIANVGKFYAQMASAQKSVKKTGQALNRAGRRMTTFISAPLAGVGILAIKTAADFQTLRQSMDILNGSAKEGARNFERLVQFSAKTPFQLQDLAKAQNMLQGFGLSADQAFESLSMIGDIAAVSGGSIEGIGIAFGQAAAEGRLMTRDIRQLINQGVPAIKLLASSMGVAQSAVLELASQGEISFADLQKAFRQATSAGGMFAEGMKKQSKTIAGLFSTLKDNVSILLSDLGNILVERFHLDEKIINLTNAVRNLTPQAKQMIVIIGSLATVIGPVVLALGALSAAIGAISLPVIAVVATLGALAAGINYVVQNAEAFGDLFTAVFIRVKNAVLESIATMIAGISTFTDKLGINLFGNLAEKIRGFKSALPNKEDRAQFSSFGESISATMKSIIGLMTQGAGAIESQMKESVQRTADVVEKFSDITVEATGFRNKLVDISNTIQKIALVDVPTLSRAWANLTVAEQRMVDNVHGLSQQITGTLTRSFVELADSGMRAAEQIRAAWLSMIASIAAQIAAKAALFSLVSILFPSGLGILTGGRTFGQFVFGNFASGGRPQVGMPSIVGERGPELFVPDVGGRIVPNQRMGGGRIEVTGVLTGRGETLEARITRARDIRNRVR